MRHILKVLLVGMIVINFSYCVNADATQQEIEVLKEYRLISADDQLKDSYRKLVEELRGYSSETRNLFLDLTDTLYKYSQANDLRWARYDIARIAWALKELAKICGEKNSFGLSGGLDTGYELEVMHEHGTEKPNTFLYKNPFKHDVDGDGRIDLYDEDEYMRQYINAQVGFTGPQIDGAFNLKLGLNYFGTGYLEDSGEFTRQYDLTMPELNDFTFSLYGSHFTAVVGDKQILGLRDYLYYDDPTNSEDYNLDGIVLQAPYGIFFGLGQETVRDWNNPKDTRDIRWIAIGTEGLGYLPVNLYLTEQEIQSLDFHKVGRNVVFALATDLLLSGMNINGDFAVNDSGDGVYTQVSVDGVIEKLAIQSKFEVSEHFTPIQPKGGFTNAFYTRTFYNGEQYAFPSRTERGVEVHGQFLFGPEIQIFGDMQKYLNAHDYRLGLHYQVLPELMLQMAGKYDPKVEKMLTVEIKSSYEQSFGSLYARTVLGKSSNLELKAEPFYANEQIKVKGLFGFGLILGTGLRNKQVGVEVTYQPIQDFTFTARYASEDMDYGVDQPGHNFTRFGRIEYKMNEWISANVTFENVDFRNPKYGYLVEYTLGGIQVQF